MAIEGRTLKSFRSRRYRSWFNLFPAYRGMGGRVRYISADPREMHIELRLT